MKVTDNRTITVEIDDTEHTMSIADAQRLYDALGALNGVKRHEQPRIHPGVRPNPPYWPYVIGDPINVPKWNESPAMPSTPRITCSSSSASIKETP